MRNIELLSPCGDFERLKLALKFGADAVYLAGEMFGMRTNPSNFNADELKEAVTLAHSLGKKVYLTLPAILYRAMKKLKSCLIFLNMHSKSVLTHLLLPI